MKFIAEDGDKRCAIRQFLLPRAKNPGAGAQRAPCHLVNDTVSFRIVGRRIGHGAIDIADKTGHHRIEINKRRA